MRYVMKAPYFFCGQDLSDCDSKDSFIKLLSKKVQKHTGIKPVGLDASAWDNSHAMYVIARLTITDKDKDQAYKTLKAVEQWFWDPKNQMLKFVQSK